MSAADPRLPTSGITLRILRDDGLTYAGVTVPVEIFNLTLGRARLAAATGLSAGEIMRANSVTFPGTFIVREPVTQGPGWCIFNAVAGRTCYIVRDDNTHLSVTIAQPNFTIAKAQAALSATAGLSGSETARITAMGAAYL